MNTKNFKNKKEESLGVMYDWMQEDLAGKYISQDDYNSLLDELTELNHSVDEVSGGGLVTLRIEVKDLVQKYI